MKTRYPLGLIIALIVLFSACQRDSAENNLPGNVKIEFEHVLDEVPIELNQWVISGTDSMLFSNFKYYISNIQLVNVNGEIWSESQSYHLIDLSDETSSLLTIANVPKGDYSSVRFMIGIDSTKNVSGDHTGSLNLNNGMYWNDTDGFQFVNLVGNASFINTGSFEFQLGGTSSNFGALQSKSFDLDGAVMSINSEATPQIHLAWDAASFVTDAANLGNVPSITSPNADGHALSIAFANALGFEHLHQ
jgi:hypothetical protein